jgi:site-specific DNA-methyltransferase (adenine-specific)
VTTPYYDRDGITIYHGEALETLRHIPTASTDLLMTDPPYSSGGMFRSDRVKAPDEKYRGWSQNADGSSRAPTASYGSFGGDNRDQRSHALWSTLWGSEALRVCKPGSQGFIFTDWRQLPTVTDAIQLGGWVWRGLVVWDKGVGRPSKGKFRNHLEYVLWCTHGAPPEVDDYPSTLVAVPTVPPGERQHVTQKPVALLAHLLRLSPASGIVLDPFMGSGSTLVAARELGYRAIGIELDERYCQIAAERLAQPSMFVGDAA